MRSHASVDGGDRPAREVVRLQEGGDRLGAQQVRAPMGYLHCAWALLLSRLAGASPGAGWPEPPQGALPARRPAGPARRPRARVALVVASARFRPRAPLRQGGQPAEPGFPRHSRAGHRAAPRVRLGSRAPGSCRTPPRQAPEFAFVAIHRSATVHPQRRRPPAPQNANAATLTGEPDETVRAGAACHSGIEPPPRAGNSIRIRTRADHPPAEDRPDAALASGVHASTVSRCSLPIRTIPMK